MTTRKLPRRSKVFATSVSIGTTTTATNTTIFADSKRSKISRPPMNVPAPANRSVIKL
jgi:hypothetical protein